MSKKNLIACVNFLNGGSMVLKGESFEVAEEIAYDYLARGLAKTEDGISDAGELQHKMIEASEKKRGRKPHG
jgi:hypothetical protein